MNASDNDTVDHRRRRALLKLVAVGLAAGTLVGVLMPYMLGHRGAPAADGPAGLSWTDFLALAIGMGLAIQGLLVALMSADRRRAGHMVDPGDPREVSPAQLAFYRSRAATLVCVGLALLVPALLARWQPGSAGLRLAVAVAWVASAIGAALSGIRMWRAADEFTRGLVAGNALLALLLGLVVLVALQVGARLGLVAAFGAWPATVLLLAVYLTVDCSRCARHGFYY